MTEGSEKVYCPIYQKDINLDLCREIQAVSSSEYIPEFIPRILEQELAPEDLRQCQECPFNTAAGS